MGFARLAIVDTTMNGMQPFTDMSGSTVVCNGEIYNYRELIDKHDLEDDIISNSDCAVLLPLYHKVGIKEMLLNELDAEFATVLYASESNRIYAARDRYGVRPLYYGFNNTTRTIGFASELKALHNIMEHVEQVRPGDLLEIDMMIYAPDVSSLVHASPYYSYNNLSPGSPSVVHPGSSAIRSLPSCSLPNDRSVIMGHLRTLFTEAVSKRLSADRSVGFLLSGGLDSSLIVAIASRILGPSNMVCFSVGDPSSPDVIAAKQVCEYLGITNHHIIPFSPTLGILNLDRTIEMIETYDVTTIRASVPQELMAQYIKKHTDVCVLLSGEGSDEIHGSYRYFRDAPSAEEHHTESVRLLRDLCYFDNQRTDRTMAGNGLEVRVPFLDYAYVEYVLTSNPELWCYREGQMEKQLLRDSFRGYLPDSVLYRSKEAFSDAVSSSETNWIDHLKATAIQAVCERPDNSYSWLINPPLTTDAIYMRLLFEQFYPGRDCVLPYYWLPRFQTEAVVDPSARVLKCY
ncbi:Glutamine-dependent asparagine synthetase [uncultured virus]|nr:Glutamine-dependent asparagine synthetase [uncultured virus]